jgi:hypothetical protein
MSEACRACPVRFAEEAGHMVGVTLRDVVPPEAQVHLLNAQRELLLALIVTIEHNTARMSDRRTPSKRGRSGAAARTRRPKRVELD